MKKNIFFTILLIITLCYSTACESKEAKLKKLCDDYDQQFGKVLLAGSDECKTDEDCACYPAGYTAEPCGGITNQTTNKKLREIDKKSDDAGCDYRAMCGAWICNPVCINGLCRNNPNRF